MELLYIVNCPGGKKVTPDHEKILAGTPACIFQLALITCVSIDDCHFGFKI
jgi:hypothetical protein